jgi:putative molybdopterin biosynthesis protein
MDGFAAIAEDTFSAQEDKPVKLKIVGKVEAGDKPKIEVARGEAVEIATGAPVPKGADAVVMVEQTDQKDDVVSIFKAVAPGENIMGAGTDMMAGENVLRTGQEITSREIGLLAALGKSRVNVYRKPRVAIISTGNELIPSGQQLDYGKIYDVNSKTLAGAILESGCEPVPFGICSDDPEEMKTKIQQALLVADLIVTSGSTSAGAGDILDRILGDFDGPGIVVHGLSVKPGKPLIIAVIEGKPLFGLPGYPTSALMMFNLIVKPNISKIAGLAVETATWLEGKVASKIFSAKGRREFLPVHIVKDEVGKHLVYPVLSGSGAITSLALADGFIDIPQNQEFIEEGEAVRVELFSPRFQAADLVFIGSHCIGLDILFSRLRRRTPTISFKIINTGSIGGLQAVKRGEADVAGIHLLDESTGEYNLPFLDQYGMAETATLIRGYNREQGFIVAKENPKKIKSFEDLLRDDISFINRNLGSGTRLLIDIHLRKVAEAKGLNLSQLTNRIRGYRVEARSHSAVAVAVLNGKADVGFGIRTAAEIYGLGFVKVTDEKYDFLIPKRRLQRNHVKQLVSELRSIEFRSELERNAPGLVATEEIGRTIN